jgi:choline dehydrogenase-like flavoprotein
MHLDLDQSPVQTVHTTVCIVGGGIAGLILASGLASQGIEVCLLEAGGLEQEDRSQSLFATEFAASTHRGVSEGRFRTFGGSSTRWGGQLLPFTPDVFAPLPGMLTPSWPIAEHELTPYYEEIQRILGTDPLPFDEELLPALGHSPLLFSPQVTLRFSKWAPFAKRNLAQTLGPKVLADPKITVLSHANVTELEGDGQRIHAARALNYSGATCRILADHFVVAAGTVESSRLVLCSPSVPNPQDQVGRYFHDHLSFHAARFASPERERILERLGPFFVDGTLHTFKLEASAATRAREGLLAVMGHVVIVEPEDSGVAAVRNLLRSLQSGALKQAIAVNLLPMLRGIGDLVRLAIYARFKRRRAVSKNAEVLLNIDVEQAPNPNNRIRLSDKRDAIGMPIAVVDWRVNPAEQDTALRFAPMLRRELEALALPPATWDESIRNDTPPPLSDTFHAMGGLRMGDDPESSVVDNQLRVHGTENLYVASCAVFPSGSSSNPTFTMMALTLRLADHLMQKLARQSAARPEPVAASPAPQS